MRKAVEHCRKLSLFVDDLAVVFPARKVSKVVLTLFDESFPLLTWPLSTGPFCRVLISATPNLGHDIVTTPVPVLQKPREGVRQGGQFLCKVVANCTPDSRKIAGISFRTMSSDEGCAKLSQICREFESQFRTI